MDAPPPRRAKVEDLASQLIDAIAHFVHARMRDGRYSRSAKDTHRDATKALMRLLREVVLIVRTRSR